MRLMRSVRAWMTKAMGLPTCEEIEQFAYAYLEGQLESTLQEKLERHLRGCGDCERFVRTYREIARPEKFVQKILLPPEFELRVAQFLKENR